MTTATKGSLLTVSTTETHEWVRLALKQGQTKLSLTYSYGGDRASATTDVDPVLFKAASAKWIKARSNLSTKTGQVQTIGQLLHQMADKARKCSTIAEFVEVM